jgi:hypothetical protein
MKNTIIDKIKEIILSSPIDIYSEESDSITEANYELVNSRFSKDSKSEEARYIGSANMFIAASLFCYDYFDTESIEELSEDQLNEFYISWQELISQLKEERFLRNTGLLSKNSIKVVVDNTKLP